MQEASSVNETERLAALALYQVLDTPPEFAFDAVTELAAEICSCPVAIVSLIDERRQWFKSKYGLPADFTECPREITVCNSTVCSNDLVYVPDLTAHERFKHVGVVTGEPHLRFYCGMPLISREGYGLGTLCVVAFEPRELRPSQREAVRRLAQQAMALLELRRQLLERNALLTELAHAKAAAEEARDQSERLLRNILPEPVARELQRHGKVEPRFHEATTILFADFKKFTLLTESLDPARLIDQLDQNFGRFDEIAVANRLETIKTIGDAYLCAGGLPVPSRSHAIDTCLAAVQMQAYIQSANRQREKFRLAPWELRIGINSGPVIAGIVGHRRFTYDIWGNAVNVAQRLEEACEPGRVNISASTFHHVSRLFEAEARGSVGVKHIGAIDMYFLNRIRPEFSADAEGCTPNAEFWRASGAG
ncbi:adenylate/guanylate cyclase domain-containing protein [Microvirga arabica]|uniref:Adenylate/guanylate cyclase domain-containing protein n=1 Tax=Microvirga arabica TaxID=1128671 RepID=A0ABV6Y4P0_9HYPH|nr:adenylate/guanylate cyclase domain-containing protein [Microvirga arabica]MBM1170952.1 GAF domain-containing protein [Microvirga arabica]